VSWLTSFKALLRADIAVQLRNTRSLYLTFALPIIWVIVLGRGGPRANVLGDPAFRVGLALTLGMVSIGVLAYSTAVARDRDQGVFQRLRVTPAPAWTIMASRWTVHLGAVLAMAVVVLIIAAALQEVTLSTQQYVLTLVVVCVGSAVFLSIGQAIVGLIPSGDTLNAAGRFLYIPLIGLSLFGHSSLLGTPLELASRWSPGGCVETLLAAAMGAGGWTGETWDALLAGVAYTVVFAGVGIRWFRWAGG